MGLAPLLSGGIILLAVVGVFCRAGYARVWWLGFSLFGGAYLTSAFISYSPSMLPPTHPLVELLQGLREYAKAKRWELFGRTVAGHWQVAHGLIALLTAIAGGAIARAMFGKRRIRPETTDDDVTALSEVRWLRHLRTVTIALASLFAIVCALASSRTSPAGPTAGPWFVLTSGVIGTGVLGAVSARGRLKQRCLGIAVFGGGYLMMAFLGVVSRPPILPFFGSRHSSAPALPSDHVVNYFRSADSPARATQVGSLPLAESNRRRIIEALERPVDMAFPHETPIDDVLRYIRDSTRGLDGWEIPIYVEPVGLEEAEKTISSPIVINLKGVPLKATLSLLLEQLGLEYRIEGGVLRITSQTADDKPAECDSFLAVGHCLLALLAAGAGALVAPLVRATV
jgi:hypothetical protein